MTPASAKKPSYVHGTYALMLNTPEGTCGICCLICGHTSYNQHDINHRYCGNCGKFHEPFTAHDGAGVQSK